MFISASDAVRLTENEGWSYCIIGSGPAGTMVALELERRGEQKIIILESGLKGHSYPHANLSKAIIRDPSRHEPMESAVARRFGGTSALWGGRCVPFDAVDFEHRTYISEKQWPLSDEEIRPYYGPACDFLECGLPDFNLKSACPAARPHIVPGFVPGNVRDDTLELWSLPLKIGQHWHDYLARSANISIALDATCVEICAALNNVHSVRIASLDGFSGTVSADQYIICAGGLESTRLLLCSPSLYADQSQAPKALGRYYQGHISGKIAEIEFTTSPDDTIYEFDRTAAGTYVRRRLTISDKALNANKTLNFAAWLDHPPIADAQHGSAILSAAYLALTFPVIGRFLTPAGIRSSVTATDTDVVKSHHLWNIIRDPIRALFFVVSFAYARYIPRRRKPGFFVKSSSNRYALHYHAEQTPSYSSHVTLCDTRDELNMPRLVIDFRYTYQDVDSVVASHKLIDDWLRKHKIGRLIYTTKNLEQSVMRQARDGFHQIGTTRMALRPEDGVVDTDLKLFGSDNLFVCSSSVFPTSSQANPTLLITALAARLAEHLVALKVN